MNDNLVPRVERACADIAGAGDAVTFTAVAARVGFAKATRLRLGPGVW
jgi:hypothetical protein